MTRFFISFRNSTKIIIKYHIINYIDSLNSSNYIDIYRFVVTYMSYHEILLIQTLRNLITIVTENKLHQ